MNEINTQQLLDQIRALSGELQGEMAPVEKSSEDPGTDLTEVMIAAQKASLSFRAMAEVRNKLVTAYQDIMNMPV